VPRILVADDNTNIQKMVSLALQQRGVEVTSVSNGEAAVRRLPDLNPDLILADIFMPVRNGYELCEWVKNDPKYSHIPVILLVGAFDPLDEKEARRVGADGVLKKPFIPPDPLIAMVTSTLEKNPRIAAEMAAASEAPAPPPPPAPVAERIPKVIEVKPEPESSASPDDASLAYGFGAGRRGLDDDQPEETAAARAPKSNFEKDAEGEDSEQTSTAHDWRRSAMSFEVPEEDSNRPAFATDEADSSWTPGTGATVSHIEPPRFEQEAKADATEAEPSKSSAARSSAPWLISQHQPAIEAEPVSPDEFSIEQPAAHVPANESLPEPAALMPEPGEISPSAAAEPEPAQPAAANSSGSSPAAAVEPSFASKASHWMDLMGSQVEKPQSDWLSSISARAKEKVREPEKSNLAPVDEARQPGAPQEHAEPAATSSSVAQESGQPESPSEDDWFFADEPQAASAPAESPAPVGETAEEPVEERIEEPLDEHAQEAAGEVEAVSAEASESVHLEWPAAQEHERVQEPTHEPVDEIEATVAEPLPLRAQALEPAFVNDESNEKSSDEPKLSHDPELIEDMGVHVTPEPLLLDESPRKSLSYGSQQEEVSPTFTFLPNIKRESSVDAVSPAPHVSEAPSVFTEQTSEPVDRHVPEASPVLPEHVSAPYEERSDSALEFSSFESAERAATPPPPTREDLAGIPFLNPPPGFDDEPEKESEAFDSSADSAVVEDVVDRVLAKIEPQLRDLLSQNLKPLLENLVQSEMQKKDR
jgi:CheY-like chemotaxis protein